MAVFDPTDTLAYHASRALCVNRDMSLVRCDHVATAINEMMASSSFKLACPESEALWFYFLNHGKSIIAQKYHPLEPLKPYDLGFVRDYHNVANNEAIRAFYYLLLICVRESRHVNNPHELSSSISAKFGVASANFNLSIQHCGSTQAYKAFLKQPPGATIGDFVKSLRSIFYHGNFSHGFGGKAWGKVCDCLCNFVDGTYSAEVMLDTVWTLCHNNGAIFNKAMFYSAYTPTLYRILDIQRSGQIAEACQSDAEIHPYVSDLLGACIEAFMKRHPGALGTYVDWYAVEAHGAVHGPYPVEKSEQAKSHGITAVQIALMNEKQKMDIAEQEAKALIAKEFEKTHFEYWPGQFAKISEKPQARAA